MVCRRGVFGLSRLATVAVVFVVLASTTAFAEEFRVAVMQDQKGAAEHFAPLEGYLAKHGVSIKLVPTESYSSAAHLFAEGKADGMFSGSGVAATMIMKDVAFPVVRPVRTDGISTYWAVVVAPEGGQPFTPEASYFKGKRVVYCALASSGQFFFRSIPGALEAAAKTEIAPSHGAAIQAVADGDADVAIVKNLVWNDLKNKYGQLESVGSDPGQNPNNTLILAKQTAPAFTKKLTGALLMLENDLGPEAQAARDGMGIKGYIVTSGADFSHTLGLLEKAGVDENFDFHY